MTDLTSWLPPQPVTFEDILRRLGWDDAKLAAFEAWLKSIPPGTGSRFDA